VEDAENEWIVQLKVKEDELFNAQSKFNDLTRQLIDLKRSLQYYRQNEKEYNSTEEYLKFLEQVLNEVEEDNDADEYSIHRKRNKINDDEQNNTDDKSLTNIAPTTSNSNENETSEKELRTLQAQLSTYQIDKDLLQREIDKLQEKSLSAELQYKQIISTCCKIDLDKVDDFVETILGEVDNDLEDEFNLGRIGEILGRLDNKEAALQL